MTSLATPSGLEAALADRFTRIFVADGQPDPTGVRAEIGSTLISVVTSHSLSQSETNVIATGGTRGLNELRIELRQSLAAQLIEAVECVTGTVVAAFLTSSRIRPNIVVDTFVLATPELTSTSSL